MSEKDLITEQFYSQVSESIKLVCDLTSRTDERIKILMERLAENEDRIARLLELLNTWQSRVLILESKDMSSLKIEVHDIDRRLSVVENSGTNFAKTEIEALKIKMQSVEFEINKLSSNSEYNANKYNKIIDFIMRLIVPVLLGYILWRLGLQAPPS